MNYIRQTSNGVNILTKLVFLFKKPKVVIILGQERKMLKKAVFQILKDHFKIDKELFIFETKEKNINKFSFFLKNSKLPILIVTDLSQPLLVKKIPLETYFILNCDDQKIKKDIESYDNFKIMKLGFSQKNDIFVSDIKRNGGTNFKINHKGSIVPFWFEKALSEQEINIILFVVSAGIILGLNLVEISQSLRTIDIGDKIG